MYFDAQKKCALSGAFVHSAQLAQNKCALSGAFVHSVCSLNLKQSWQCDLGTSTEGISVDAPKQMSVDPPTLSALVDQRFVRTGSALLFWVGNSLGHISFLDVFFNTMQMVSGSIPRGRGFYRQTIAVIFNF